MLAHNHDRISSLPEPTVRSPPRLRESLPPPGPGRAALDLFALAVSGWVPEALYVVAQLGIAGLLSAGPRTAVELACSTGAHAPSLYRLLRALSTVGVFVLRDDGTFDLTPMGELLRPDVPGSMHNAVLAYHAEWRRRAWDELLPGVITGRNAFVEAHGTGLFDHLARHPDAASTFDDGQSSLVTLTEAEVVRRYDFSDARVLVDVAGGHGRLLAAVLKANPHLTGILFDLPHVIEGARRHMRLEAAGVGGRSRYVAGDFFRSLPAGGDAYLFQRALHAWDDAGAHTILRNCRDAIAPSGKVLLVEHVVGRGPAHPLGAFFDLEMMVVAGGRTRTEDELRALLRSAGFWLTRVIPTDTPFSIVEAVPV